MALTTCPKCGKIITDTIEHCPSCIDLAHERADRRRRLRRIGRPRASSDVVTWVRTEKPYVTKPDIGERQVASLSGSMGIGTVETLYSGGLKREALIVDRIGICMLSTVLVGLQVNPETLYRKSILSDDRWLRERYSDPANISHDLRNLQWLVEQDILFEPNEGLLSGVNLQSDIDEVSFRPVLGNGFTAPIFLNAMQWLLAHNVSMRLRLSGKDALLIAEKRGWEFDASQMSLDRTLSVVINSFPYLDDSVPWEEVLQFKSDPDHRAKLSALRVWMSEVTATNLSSTEISQQLEFLLHDYSSYMKLQKMKTRMGILKSVLTAPLATLENILKIRWTKLGDPLFSLAEAKFQLLEAERKAPGRHVSYLLDARSRFDSRGMAVTPHGPI